MLSAGTYSYEPIYEPLMWARKSERERDRPQYPRIAMNRFSVVKMKYERSPRNLGRPWHPIWAAPKYTYIPRLQAVGGGGTSSFPHVIQVIQSDPRLEIRFWCQGRGSSCPFWKREVLRMGGPATIVPSFTEDIHPRTPCRLSPQRWQITSLPLNRLIGDIMKSWGSGNLARLSSHGPHYPIWYPAFYVAITLCSITAVIIIRFTLRVISIMMIDRCWILGDSQLWSITTSLNNLFLTKSTRTECYVGGS